MKILVIPDIHGRSKWQPAVKENINKVDKVVFLGDYVDSYNIDGYTQLLNLDKVVKIKKENMDKVILLLGNHDIHYITQAAPMSSGFNAIFAARFKATFTDNIDLFQVAWSYGDHLFAHAGVSDPFWNKINKKTELEPTAENVAMLLNAEHSARNSVLYNVGMDRGGRGYGGPLWADKHTLKQYPLQSINQHVGHTQGEQFEKHVIKDGYTLNFYDCMEQEDWKPEIVEIII